MKKILLPVAIGGFAAGALVNSLWVNFLTEKPAPSKEQELSQSLLILSRAFDHDKPASLTLTTPAGEKMHVSINWEGAK